jgi:hypothetical protein
MAFLRSDSVWNQELGNWESSVAIFESVSDAANFNLESLVPKSWLRDINRQNIDYLCMLCAVRKAIASSAWSDVEVVCALVVALILYCVLPGCHDVHARSHSCDCVSRSIC